MSLEIPVDVRRSPVTELIKIFLSEANEMLDDSIPISRRAAMTYKWCIIFSNITGKSIECRYLLTHGEIVRKVTELLEVSAQIVKARA